MQIDTKIRQHNTHIEQAFLFLSCCDVSIHRYIGSLFVRCEQKRNLWQCKPNYSSFFFSFGCDCTLRRLETLSFLHFCPLSSQMYKYTHTTQALSYAFAISIALSSASFSIYLGVQFIFAHHLHIIYNIKYIFCVF